MNRTVIALAACGLLAVGCDGPDPTTPTAEGLAVTPQANKGPDGSQRLRGLGGRVFSVHVEQLSGPGLPNEFDNCYFFQADGTFIDPPFPAPGTWTQHSVGAATPFTANAEVVLPGLGLLTLVQEGTVTPARGKGVLQFEAYTTVVAPEVSLELLFLSVGEEVDECPLDL